MLYTHFLVFHLFKLCVHSNMFYFIFFSHFKLLTANCVVCVLLIFLYLHRNGTPRQPLLVPLARACLVFNTTRVPPASLEGLEGYSHCWIIYVFHLNTDLEKLWKNPSHSKFKAKVSYVISGFISFSSTDWYIFN